MGQPHLPHIFYILIMDIKIIIGLIITGIVIFGLLFYLFFRKIKKNISSLNEQVNNLKSCKEILKEEVTEYAIKKENLTTEISENSRLLDILKVEKDGNTYYYLKSQSDVELGAESLINVDTNSNKYYFVRFVIVENGGLVLAVSVEIVCFEGAQHLRQLLRRGGHGQAEALEPVLVDPHGVVVLQFIHETDTS